MAAPIADLDTFLAALRLEGITVGPRERVWLQHALQLTPAPERLDFKAMLACALIKHQGRRERFEALFDTWYPPEPDDAERVERPPEMQAPLKRLLTAPR